MLYINFGSFVEENFFLGSTYFQSQLTNRMAPMGIRPVSAGRIGVLYRYTGIAVVFFGRCGTVLWFRILVVTGSCHILGTCFPGDALLPHERHIRQGHPEVLAETTRHSAQTCRRSHRNYRRRSTNHRRRRSETEIKGGAKGGCPRCRNWNRRR